MKRVSSVRRVLSVRGMATIVGLTAAWCALWGSVSVANVASGVVVSSVASLAGGRPGGAVRIVPLGHLLWLVAIDLAVSTGVVVREVLTPTDHTDEAIIGVPVPPSGRAHLLFLYVAITVTPGTAVVAAPSDASTVYLHVLHADRAAEVERHVAKLFAVADRAFPGPDRRRESVS